MKSPLRYAFSTSSWRSLSKSCRVSLMAQILSHQATPAIEHFLVLGSQRAELLEFTNQVRIGGSPRQDLDGRGQVGLFSRATTAVAGHADRRADDTTTSAGDRAKAGKPFQQQAAVLEYFAVHTLGIGLELRQASGDQRCHRLHDFPLAGRTATKLQIDPHVSGNWKYLQRVQILHAPVYILFQVAQIMEVLGC